MRAAVVLLIAFAVALPLRVQAAAPPLRPPQIEASQTGALIEAVTIETYGVINADAVRQYLSLRKGDALEQDGVDRDYENLLRLVAFIPRLEIRQGSAAHTVTLHWIVMAKWLQATSHSFYTNQPVVSPIQGVQGPGAILTSPQVNARGANFSIIGQAGPPTFLTRVLYTNPLHVNPKKARQSDFVFDVFGGRSLYRATQPFATDIFSWNTGAEALYWLHAANGTQLVLGARIQRSTTAVSTGIVAPSLYLTSQHPAHNMILEAGYSHACPVAPTQWYPPYCSTQYRFGILDAIGLFNATSEYQIYYGELSHYIPVRASTLAVHVISVNTGGILPESALVCGGARAYPKPFCGTDAQTLQAEYRITDRIQMPLHIAVFTETAGSRIRGGTQAFAQPAFQWHADSGIGIIYRGVRINFAKGSEGSRVTFELQGQAY